MSKSSNKWVLIDGGGNSGKTTIIEYLKKLGYSIKSEQATLVINDSLNEGIKMKQLVSDPEVAAKFQEDIATRELNEERKFKDEELVFFDRACIDYAGVTKLRNLKQKPEILDMVKDRSYALAVIPDILPGSFTNNRTESVDNDPYLASKRLERAIIEVIEARGIPILRLPVVGVEARVDMILEECRSRGVM